MEIASLVQLGDRTFTTNSFSLVRMTIWVYGRTNFQVILLRHNREPERGQLGFGVKICE